MIKCAGPLVRLYPERFFTTLLAQVRSPDVELSIESIVALREYVLCTPQSLGARLRPVVSCLVELLPDASARPERVQRRVAVLETLSVTFRHSGTSWSRCASTRG